VGYAGGEKKNPTYRDLGDHTETIQLDYDPQKISYEQLLDIFWQNHNPSANAISIQYKHVVFYHNDTQKELAVRSRDRVAKKLGREIQTEILPYTGFDRAEDYHQKYKLRHAHDIMAEFDNMYSDYDDFVDSTAAARINGYLYGYGTMENLQAEVDSFGISVEAKEKLLALMRRRSGVLR
jgi:peptide-methionine (S)-S-oxide reductase